MLEDLNSPIALAALGELAKIGNELCDLAQKRRKDAGFSMAATQLAGELLERITELKGWLGVLTTDVEAYRARTQSRRAKCRGLTISVIEAKLHDRSEARTGKDFKRSDTLRDELLQLGVTVQDTAEGQTWTIEA